MMIILKCSECGSENVEIVESTSYFQEAGDIASRDSVGYYCDVCDECIVPVIEDEE